MFVGVGGWMDAINVYYNHALMRGAEQYRKSRPRGQFRTWERTLQQIRWSNIPIQNDLYQYLSCISSCLPIFGLRFCL